ncbi:filamentous hemagglutinin N-terminal domain-containing protein [Robbsia sp. Bb-Pol-6]|uniref:Filamentous hemagglutinin N-terminal domain-containing protein n=1 Tax=Robbsia betulipollinis TaxID=2981849 RepID=A0ABT3ZHJ3_9BURK|nr:filamentous hemagglutinin N-terminal domain-containing protein [Robbsia betulipollinis]MCY0385988.1 filamentous hemagglutinin N-terminal domain-containing protein [Robbsia betulipollinis]
MSLSLRSSFRWAGIPLPASRPPVPCRLRRAPHAVRAWVFGAWLVCGPAHALAPFALPEGEHVREGAVAITRDPGGMRLDQTSEHAIIDWRSFDIGRRTTVQVRQNSPQSMLLNRVTGMTVSELAGGLAADGRIYLVNPNGITITPQGTVDAAAFVASTLDIGNAAFLSGATRFGVTRPAFGTLMHAGRITAKEGGLVALLGHRIEQSGAIMAPRGRVGLGAGARATITTDGDTLLVMTPAAERRESERAAILLSGTIDADGGLVQISAPLSTVLRPATDEAVNLSGMTRARTHAARPGKILIEGEGGTVRLSGMLNASGSAVSGAGSDAEIAGHVVGGTVEVNGLRVMAQGGDIDVSGERGGGCVALTARPLGGNGHARSDDDRVHDPLLFVDDTTTLNASATRHGPGGELKLLSAGKVVFLGRAQARGAASETTQTPHAAASASGQ